MPNLLSVLKKIIPAFLVLLILSSCGGCKLPKPGDARKIPASGKERALKNIEEGRGVSIGKALGGRKTTYQFSTSNPMWQATFDVIDFMPLVTVDYAGGMIITDWYADSNTTNDSLKFTFRFLSNEIRADSFKIIILPDGQWIYLSPNVKIVCITTDTRGMSAASSVTCSPIYAIRRPPTMGGRRRRSRSRGPLPPREGVPAPCCTASPGSYRSGRGHRCASRRRTDAGTGTGAQMTGPTRSFRPVGPQGRVASTQLQPIRL